MTPPNPWYFIGVLNPKIDGRVDGLEYLHERPASERDTPAENLMLMVSKLIHMSKMLSIYMTTDDGPTAQLCLQLADEIHLHEELATARIYDLEPDMSKGIFKIVLPFPSRLERISLSFKNILSSWRIKTTEGIPISDQAQEELAQILQVVVEILESLRDVLLTPDKFMLEQMRFQGEKLKQLVDGARLANWERLQARVCRPQRASVYLDVLDSLKNVNEYAGRMYDSLRHLLLELESSTHGEENDR